MKVKLKYDGEHIDLDFEGSIKEYNAMLDRMNLHIETEKTEKTEKAKT